MVTALGFDYFARSGVEIAVIETGLGGRLDATNVLTPALSIVTDISYDHIDILGHTLTKIAREKAGIVKPSIPHLIGLLPKEAEKVMVRRCRQRKAPLHKLTLRHTRMYPSEFALDFASRGLNLRKVKPSLLGAHQLKNTALALEAVALLRERGIRISKQAVVRGISSTYWPGRFQIMSGRGKPTLVLDVCHNPSGVKAFVETFHTKFPGRKARIIVGVVRKKEHQPMFDTFASIAQEYDLVPLKTRRSTSTRELMQAIDWQGVPVRRFGSLASACDAVVKTASADDIILIVGSHYLVGEFLKTHGWS